MSELRPCPFCGGYAEIVVCDDEGNIMSESYEQDAWSGLGYRIVHESGDCPVETDEEGGHNIYDTREEAGEHWNRRENERVSIPKVCHGDHGPEPHFDGDVWTVHDACSECGWPMVRKNAYCPHCGARVIKEES